MSVTRLCEAGDDTKLGLNFHRCVNLDKNSNSPLKKMADRIAFIVERLNMSPFHKGFGTMSEFDGKSSLELLEIL